MKEDPLLRSKPTRSSPARIGSKDLPPEPEPPYVTGGPPFPNRPTDDGRYGISILDYFAAHVIQGLAARDNLTIDDLKLDGAVDAYYIAATMVNLRSALPIEPTPVPVPPSEEVLPDLVMPPDSLLPGDSVKVGGA